MHSSLSVPPEINQPSYGHILVIGRDPGENEVEQGRPFVGRAGELLDEMLAQAGFRRQDVNIANVVGYRPPQNDFKLHQPNIVYEGVAQLRALVTRLKPSLTITLGNEAAWALVPGWPKGDNIFTATGITDRRGYIWETPYGQVLTTLHPAGVLRKAVPGRYLLATDFRRARRVLRGDLPRDQFPPLRRLDSDEALAHLQKSKLVSWDIETKWGMEGLLCSGFAGDDLQPYVCGNLREFFKYGKRLLTGQHPRLVGHNGPGFDIPAMYKFFGMHVTNYTDDTQQMWWALEPDLAGSEDTDEDDKSVTRHRMTRKGLAFLASLWYNYPWWKNYPDSDHPQHDELMLELNAKDAHVTRRLANDLLRDIDHAGVAAQYRLATNLYPATVEMQLRGIKVDEELRFAREGTLRARSDAAKEVSEAVALKYVTEHQVEAFSKKKKCTCCGGGKKQALHCPICNGAFVQGAPKITLAVAKTNGFKTIKAFRDSWTLPCHTCKGTGKVITYSVNMYSPTQMKKLMYETLGTPKHIWKGKETTDAQALRKVLRWAKNA